MDSAVWILHGAMQSAGSTGSMCVLGAAELQNKEESSNKQFTTPQIVRQVHRGKYFCKHIVRYIGRHIAAGTSAGRSTPALFHLGNTFYWTKALSLYLKSLSKETLQMLSGSFRCRSASSLDLLDLRRGNHH